MADMKIAKEMAEQLRDIKLPKPQSKPEYSPGDVQTIALMASKMQTFIVGRCVHGADGSVVAYTETERHTKEESVKIAKDLFDEVRKQTALVNPT